MARDPAAKPPRVVSRRVTGKAKYVATKPPLNNNNLLNQKPTKEIPFLLRRNSGASPGSIRRNSNQSNGSIKRVQGWGPALGRDTSTPRARVEEDLFIQAVAEATSKSVKKRIPRMLVQEADARLESPLSSPRSRDLLSSDDDDDDENYPAVCRRCYINFSTVTSPVCSHRYCDDCYEKCTVPNAAKDKEPKDKFACFACAKTESEAGSRAASFSRAVPILEYCADEMNKVYAFGSYAFINPQRCAVAADGKTIVVIDSGCGKILLLNTDGELHQFSYLKNYHFLGGLCITSDDNILLSLQNEKYTSASFYSMAGSFKFSAFLDSGAKVTHLVVNSDDDIIALDTSANTLDIINERKRIHKQKSLSDSEVFNPVSIAVHPITNYLYIYDANNQAISIFDDKFHFLSKIKLPKPSDDPQEKTMKIIIDSDGILFRVSKTWIKAYNIEGQFIYDAVKYEGNPSFQAVGMCALKPTIRDTCLAGPGKIAVLMTGGAHTGELRIYEYTIPQKFKTKPKRAVKLASDACCVVS
jgi:DNA-binding beta-propeller fold protein YncE